MNFRPLLTIVLVVTSLSYALTDAKDEKKHLGAEEVLVLTSLIKTHPGYVLLTGDVSSFVLQLPTDAYTGEPLVTDKQQKGEFNLENLRQYIGFGSREKPLASGLSVLLAQINEKVKLTIVGFRIADGLANSLEKINLVTKDMDYMSKFKVQAIQKYITVFSLPKNILAELIEHPGELSSESRKSIEEQKIVHFGGLAISPSHRKKGLSYVLVNKSIELAREAGYRYIVVETTGNASYKIMVKCGFKLIDEYRYEAPIQGHDAYRVLLLTLID